MVQALRFFHPIFHILFSLDKSARRLIDQSLIAAQKILLNSKKKCSLSREGTLLKTNFFLPATRGTAATRRSTPKRATAKATRTRIGMTTITRF